MAFEFRGRLLRRKEEQPLYGENENDFPEVDILVAQANARTKKAIERFPDSLDDYDRQWWTEYRPCDVYRGPEVYAPAWRFAVRLAWIQSGYYFSRSNST